MSSPTTKLIAFTGVCSLLCLLLVGCAQTGAPLPPSLELLKPPTDLRASRKGDLVTLTWSQPSLTTDRQSARYIGPTMICRSQKSEISECGTPIEMLSAPAPVPTTAPAPASQSSKPQSASRPAPVLETYTDRLPPALLRSDASAELTYAVEVLNRNARGAGISNRVHIPGVPTLPPPGDLSVQLNDEGAVLSWTSAGEPAESADLKHIYRIYRQEEASRGKDVIAGEVPVGAPGSQHFTDSGFEWEKTYLYRITAVSIVQQTDHQTQVEGDDTAPVRVVAHDTFPPAVPTGLQAAFSGEGQTPFIDLVWAPVTNADLAGYNVYRTEAGGDATGNTGGAATKMNADPVKSPSYRDAAVSSGKTYTYSVSAVDVRGNESQRSESTSEPVP
jgi:hypothetical protein